MHWHLHCVMREFTVPLWFALPTTAYPPHKHFNPTHPPLPVHHHIYTPPYVLCPTAFPLSLQFMSHYHAVPTHSTTWTLWLFLGPHYLDPAHTPIIPLLPYIVPSRIAHTPHGPLSHTFPACSCLQCSCPYIATHCHPHTYHRTLYRAHFLHLHTTCNLDSPPTRIPHTLYISPACTAHPT